MLSARHSDAITFQIYLITRHMQYSQLQHSVCMSALVKSSQCEHSMNHVLNLQAGKLYSGETVSEYSVNSFPNRL